MGALAVTLLAAEITARLDDRLFNETPILSNPDREHDLLQAEPWGYRGKPYGLYRRWQLNRHGFLGPEINETASGKRIMVLGASETFGLYEAKGKDYPAQLAVELARLGNPDVEVVNAAIVGQAVPSITAHWVNWASRFKPDIVLIYPSSHFYLDVDPPRPAIPSTRATPHKPPLQSRFAERLKDQAKQIPVLRSMRARHAVAAALAGKDRDFTFATPPANRLAAMITDLDHLMSTIERSGGRPVLVTHAFKMPLPIEPRDRAELEYFRIAFPRAAAEVFPAFGAAARTAIIELGKARGWPVIDAAEKLTGRRELFADPVHFTTDGARQMAVLLAEALHALLGPAPRNKPPYGTAPVGSAVKQEVR